MQDYHAEFVEIYNKNITRPGADRLLNWLETTDFFTAPASTRFHGACEGGLVMHSLNVYHAMMQHFFTEGENSESYAICGLLHDLCKANFYKVSTRNVKTTPPASGRRSRFTRWRISCPTATARRVSTLSSILCG